jgi:hypothetical protein
MQGVRLFYLLGLMGLDGSLVALDMGSVSMQRVSGNNWFVVRSQAPTSLTNSVVDIAAVTSGGITGSGISMDSGGAISLYAPAQILMVHPAEIHAGSTTGARPTLTLLQNDNSEEFIEFDGASGAGVTTPISTALLGTYAGKVRISINGSFFWLPYY